MKRIWIITWIFLLAAFLAGCNLQNANATPDLVGTIVAETSQAMTAAASGQGGQATLSAVTSTPIVTRVSGAVCYPAAGVQHLTAYFVRSDTGVAEQLSIPSGTWNYEIELEPGTYTAFAWVDDYSIGGSYSACGDDFDCKNAAPLAFNLAPNTELTGIDLCDWSHGPWDVPYPPGYQPTVMEGWIDGQISGYPYGAIPQLALIAFNQETHYWYMYITAAGQSYFSITELPAGDYIVAAYDGSGHVGGVPYTVTVNGGTGTNVAVNDWAGSYPDDPR